MENRELIRDSTKMLPSLIRYISENEVAGFDSVKEHNDLNDQADTNCFHPSTMGIDAAGADKQSNPSLSLRMHSISISMPPSPSGNYIRNATKLLFVDNNETIYGTDVPNSAATFNNYANAAETKEVKFHSQPMPLPTASPFHETKIPSSTELPLRNPAIHRPKDNRFDSFKTWSGKLERQISNLRGKHQDATQDSNLQQNVEVEALPVHRYFDALQGPELDTLRPSEEILLSQDKQWPFLLRFPISSFSICLGMGSQAIMWKAIATSASTKFLQISQNANLILWCISVALLVIISSMYFLKVVFYFEAVRREYFHPVRVNFFFSPWIALLFLLVGVPPSVSENLHAALWYILMIPIFCLELKIYGQWMSGGQRRLSKVANPSNHLSVVGNFVGALLGASMGLKEGPIFFFAVGLAHYVVLFVTLYQRLPTNATLPKELHPVFFLFVAAPSVASMAWARIQGSFDYGSRIAYFISMFLYLSLAVRINFFRGFRFSLAWWAYTFPMSGAATATIRYSNVVTNVFTKCLATTLCSIATLVVTALLITTIIHAFVLGDLFPNDIAIAISERRPKATQGWFLRRLGSSDTKDIEHYLKFANPDEKDVEASVTPPSSTTEEVCTCGMKEVQSSVSQP